MDARLRAYLDAVKAYTLAEKQAAETADTILKVANGLTTANVAIFLRDLYQLPVPATGPAFIGCSDPVDMTAWPTADEIEHIMQAWHAAYMAMIAAWDAVPDDRKASGEVNPPPPVLALEIR